jgi:hypothetical protein
LGHLFSLSLDNLSFFDLCRRTPPSLRFNALWSVARIPLRSEFVFPVFQGFPTLNFDINSRVRVSCPCISCSCPCSCFGPHHLSFGFSFLAFELWHLAFPSGHLIFLLLPPTSNLFPLSDCSTAALNGVRSGEPSQQYVPKWEPAQSRWVPHCSRQSLMNAGVLLRLRKLRRLFP